MLDLDQFSNIPELLQPRRRQKNLRFFQPPMLDQFVKCKRILLGWNSSEVQKAPRRDVERGTGRSTKGTKKTFGNEVADRISVRLGFFPCFFFFFLV